jgi:hypothetical protein
MVLSPGTQPSLFYTSCQRGHTFATGVRKPAGVLNADGMPANSRG